MPEPGTAALAQPDQPQSDTGCPDDSTSDGKHTPAKLAGIESQWETETKGTYLFIYLWETQK